MDNNNQNGNQQQNHGQNAHFIPLLEKTVKRVIKGEIGPTGEVWTHVTRTIQEGETSRLEEEFHLRTCSSCSRIYGDRIEPVGCWTGHYCCTSCSGVCGFCGRIVCAKHSIPWKDGVVCRLHYLRRYFEGSFRRGLIGTFLRTYSGWPPEK